MGRERAAVFRQPHEVRASHDTGLDEERDYSVRLFFWAAASRFISRLLRRAALLR